MKNIKKIKDLRVYVRAAAMSRERIGLVPTMGCFHEGHLSLIRKSAEENDITIVSIFVNPAQFAGGEDFSRYPRDMETDEALAREEGVDYLFSPLEDEMYPPGYGTFVEVGELGRKLCGKSRPGHFRGVATVVLKLVNICGPDALYLGQKDAQQAVILRKMINDFNMDVEARILPAVREEDGLAMSSRNRYLSPAERASAPALYTALCEAKQAVLEEGLAPVEITRQIRESLSRAEGMDIDYAEVVSPADLEPVRDAGRPALIAAAVKLGGARLIDNVLLNCEEL